MPISVEQHRDLWLKSGLKEVTVPVNVPVRAWHEYFPAETERLATTTLFSGTKISIGSLEELAASLPASPENNRDLFIATMMWGRGPKNGRMMPKFKLAASHPEFLRTLSITRESVANGRLGDAYLRWVSSGIAGIRESYFTKWLFVCSLSNEPEVVRAFTLDNCVRASLKTLGWPDAALNKTLRGKPSYFYEAYVHVLYHWATELSREHERFDPLDVEQFLFRKNGNVPLSK